VRLTESGNARSEQLVMIPTEQLTDCGATRMDYNVGRPVRYEILDLQHVHVENFGYVGSEEQKINLK